MKAADDLSQVFAEALVRAGERDDRVVVLDTDLPDSCSTEAFAQRFPDRVWDLGIAEQSLPTVAAGIALCGGIPICNSFAVFAVHRGVDMIRQSVCYNRANVKIVGHAAGQSMGYTGPTHHTLEDLALMRALPGMTVLQPSDGPELAQMIDAMIAHDGPVYLRLPRVSVPPLHGESYRFEIGRPDVLRPGGDVTVFVTGDLAGKVLSLADALAAEGVFVGVVNIPTIKPLDAEAVVAIGRETAGAVTVEDHSVVGGLGGLIAEIYSESLGKPVKRVGIRDTFTESASGEELRARYGLSDDDIVDAIRSVLRTASLSEGGGNR